jgi:hypothetical protein
MISIWKPKTPSNRRMVVLRLFIVVVGISLLTTFGQGSLAAPSACRPLSDKPISQIITSVHASLTTDGFILIDFEMNPIHEFFDTAPCSGDPDGMFYRSTVSSNVCALVGLFYTHSDCQFFGPHGLIEVAPCSLTTDMIVGWDLRFEQRWCNLGANPVHKKGSVTIGNTVLQALENGGGPYDVTSTVIVDQ